MQQSPPLCAEDYKLIQRVARRLHRRLPPAVDFGDLINDGYFGLLSAREHFDPGKGVPFERYAAGRIRGAMLDGLRSRAWIPRMIRRDDRHWPRIVIGRLEHHPQDDPGLHRLCRIEQQQRARSILARLRRQARRVLHLYYFEAHSMKEVGMILGVSEARVSQIHARTVRRLRQTSNPAGTASARGVL